MVPKYEIIQVPAPGEAESKELYDQCIDVRIQVFTYEQGFDLDCEVDDLDPIATHFLLRLLPSLKPIGTIRMTTPPEPASYYKLSRLVVLKEFRQFGLGKALVEAAHRWAIEEFKKTNAGQSGPVEVVLHSQIYAKAFYSKSGYVPEGDEFEEDGAPHQKMKARLAID